MNEHGALLQGSTAALLLEETLEDLNNLVSDLARLLVSSKVLGAEPESTDLDIVQDDPDGLLDRLGLLLLAERVPQHERDTEDRADGVGDLHARDVGGGTVDGLVETGDGLGAVRNASERGGGEEAEGTGDDGSLVGENVAEEVLGCEDEISEVAGG